LAGHLSALGHVDIDWRTRTWSVAPPAINVVPGLGLCVVLTGSRPFYVDRRFDEATDDLNVFPFSLEQPPWPTAKFAKCASVDDARDVAERTGARFVLDPASALVEALRAVDEEVTSAAPEPPLEEAAWFDPAELRWRKDHDRRPGLYQIDLHNRPVHRWHDANGSWWYVDRAAGQFRALDGRDDPVVRWHRATASEPARFEVRRGLALPLVAERALTTCSGLAAVADDRWRCYVNVPRKVAARVATALKQPDPTRSDR
jgi:hypothetical protein